MEKLPIINGQEPSKEEVYFLWWCKELQQAGYIEDFGYKARTFELTDPVQWAWIKQLKTKQVMETRSIFDKTSYTPDFTIVFSEKAMNVFVYDNATTYQSNPFNHFRFLTPYAHIDVKGGFDRYGSSQKKIFDVLRKWVWHKHMIYIHRIEIPKLFEQTFCPDRYRLTDMTLKERKLNHDYLTLEQFIKQTNEWKGKNICSGLDLE